MHRFQKWREALQLAPDANTVQGIVRDYVEAIRPIVGVLPEDCGRVLLQSELNIQSAAVTLLQAELRATGDDEQRALLHEIAHTLAAAAVRITLLHPRASSPPPGTLQARSRTLDRAARNDE
jgi:hypothetical protein